jgi:L-threonylcarbamoyladenylate synthase
VLRLTVDPLRPDSGLIQQAAHLLHHGGIGAIPTDTLYGLAADPFDARAVARVFEIKGRDPDRALPLVAADAVQVFDWLGEMTPLGLRLAERFWPGPLTLVIRAPLRLAPGVADARHTVGVRVPDHAVTRALCDACGRPLTATSANISGQPATADAADVARQLGGKLDVIVDAGRLAGGRPSTIVDVTGQAPLLVREGAVSWDEVVACAHHG